MPFTKGDPNINREGRPKGSFSLVTIMRQKLETMSPDQKRSAAEILTENVIQDALDGKKHAVDTVFKYMEGLPTQKIEAEVSFPKPILGGLSEEDELQADDSNEEDSKAE